MRITIDFDETLFPTLHKIIEIYNKRNKSELLFDDIKYYNLYECFDVVVADAIIDLFCDNEVYRTLLPFSGAVAAVQQMVGSGHEIYVATSSDAKNIEWKEQLLQKHFPFIPKNNLIRIYNKSLLNTDVLIEDNLDNLKKCYSDRICFDQLWNRSESADYVYDIKRCSTWFEIANKIKEIEKEDRKWNLEQ